MNATQIIILIYSLIVAGTCVRVILENKNPLKTHSYLLIIIALPVGGLLIYYFFGVNLRKEKIFVAKEKIDQIFIQNYLKNYKADLQQRRTEIEDRLQGKIRLPHLFFNNSNSVFTRNNHIEFLHCGENKFPVLLDAMENAMQHIHIEYYIFYGKDDIGKRIIDLICQKAKAGVEVRLLVDSFGSKIPGRQVKQMNEAGVQVAFYRPLWSPKYLTKSNYRDHRKIVVIDGNIGFIGGINVADYYINTLQTKKYWADLHCKIEGDSVYALQLLFFLNWRFATNEEFGSLQKYLSPHEIKSNLPISILGSNASSRSPAIMDAYFTMITTALNEVLITTPYFIPNEAILKAILITAKSGVEVKILLPKVSDGYMVQMACLSYVDQLLENNVRVFLYKKGMIHSKYMVVDGNISTLGTTNIDERSFNINAEVNAFIIDVEKAGELKSHFESDLLLSEEIILVEWQKRSRFKKLQESLFRLIAPLL
ncbi:MAG: cardiolipin synthase [Chitinophagales bacterium]|nr:cardiolipin synthase [Chitinophagales bacterium]MBP8753302.1 cardiolipin synthase [Chitinophagales bacterium]MBP9188407.1 cardiolipin synthase [Chitinophagales bacterium]MBP9703427.1 cardiolipin synthase [Chitinophagales bacterium]